MLTNIIILRDLDRKKKSDNVIIKFPVKRVHPVIEQLRKIYTPHAVEKVQEQMDVPTTSFSTIYGVINNNYCN